MRRRRSEGAASPTTSALSLESFAPLRTNVELALPSLTRPSVMVTSAVPGEGKTATAVNLGRTLALAGHRVVLVDLDLRHPDAHHHFGVGNKLGIADVLLGRRPPEDCLQFVLVDPSLNGTSPGLYLLPAGEPEADLPEIVDNQRTRSLLSALAQQADIVLLDCPSVLGSTDALSIGRFAGGAILVVESRRTSAGMVQQARDALLRHQVRLLGVVLNTTQS